MYEFQTLGVILPIMGGFIFIFAFGNRIQDWYDERKRPNLREVKE